MARRKPNLHVIDGGDEPADHEAIRLLRRKALRLAVDHYIEEMQAPLFVDGVYNSKALARRNVAGHWILQAWNATKNVNIKGMGKSADLTLEQQEALIVRGLEGLRKKMGKG